jgi:hypothetical protein
VHLGRVFGGEGLKLLEILARVDDDATGVLPGDVAKRPLHERQVLMEERGSGRRESAAADPVPELAQILDVAAQLRVARVFGHGAYDEPSGLAGRQELLKLVAQHLPLGLVLDPL